MSKYWSVPRLWAGETAVLLAGGPSLTQDQVDFVEKKREEQGIKVVVINNSYQLAPWADLLYFCDSRWYNHHKDHPDFLAFEGLKVTLRNLDLPEDIRKLDNRGPRGLCKEPTGVSTGRNSGYQVINITYHLGVKRDLLLGYDMRVANGSTHWHEGHPWTPSLKVYVQSMLPCFDSIVNPLQEAGLEVINCTPGSALEVFPKADIKEVLT